MDLHNEELEQIGLATRWWLEWDKSKGILESLKAAYVEHWNKNLSEALENNKGSNHASTWAQLRAGIRRNPQNATRHLRQIPGPLLRFSYAFVLGVDSHSLEPTKQHILSEGTKYLVNSLSNGTEWEFGIYARYVCENSIHDTRLDLALVEKIALNDDRDLNDVLTKLRSAALIVGKTIVRKYKFLLNDR